ncbi:MAG TPA: YciI family protein [Gammaproteobacteria bacterium]|nr:YciI family protein [Gammaproteobacteria bacterium]
MQYAIFIYADESAFQKMSRADMEQGMAAYTAYTQALKQAGVLQGSNRLRPVADSTTVRVANGKSQVLNGPYADTKEQLGGYYLIDVPDLDAALKWAARCPGASHGAVEVRPIWTM